MTCDRRFGTIERFVTTLDRASSGSFGKRFDDELFDDLRQEDAS
jgi:hypothetical protein